MLKNNEDIIDDVFDPQNCDLKSEIKKNMSNPLYKKAYDQSVEEYALLHAMLEAQQKSKLSQGKIAEKMNVKQPSISRMLSGKHQVSFNSVISFIHANGMRIKNIELETIEG